jgi:purine-binding chemotaxis protein CheW
VSADEPRPPLLAFATEETYLHATARARDEAVEVFLAVEVAHETYGIPTEAVREIIRTIEITEVPRLPRSVLGVISVRGAIIPVLDMRVRLGFAAAPPERSSRIVIVAVDGQRFGLRIDDVLGLERVRDVDLEPAPAIFGASRGGVDRYIRAVGRTVDRSDRIVVFLELAALVDLSAELSARRQPRANGEGEARS